MPKIKVKNIPVATSTRICNSIKCSDCPLYIRDDICFRLNNIVKEGSIELTERDFPTNREWMESLSNFELAALMTSGYAVKDGRLKGLNATTNLMTDINEVTEWLSQPCQYLMEEE